MGVAAMASVRVNVRIEAVLLSVIASHVNIKALTDITIK
jgi:hypothetical protein